MTKSNNKQKIEATSSVATSQQSNKNDKPDLAARREFMIRALAATSGLALAGALPSAAIDAAAQTQSCPPATITSPSLQAIGQITSQNGKLQAIMRVRNESRAVPGYSKPPMLRYFTGSRIDGSQVWPTRPGQPVPGPTLVAELGDVVQVALMNETKVSDFAGTLDLAESGQTSGTGCQSATKVDTTTNPPTTTNSYPGTFDQFPNCFHGSSTANLHFHGTHVTPEATGDNILFGVRPVSNLNEQEALADLQAVFNSYDPANPWHNWNDFIKSPAAQNWWKKQQAALANYDKTSQWGNGFGLPPSEQLLPADTAAIAAGEWPPWFIGSFPNCYKIPRYTTDANGKPTGPLMGQAPGTHWYHAHKHGSTALNLFNGLAGAFIIRDSSPTGYDGKLRAVYPGLNEKIMVFQEITDSINLLGGGIRTNLVNGQKTPMVTMQPGEVQLWRLLNTTVTAALTPQIATATAAGAPLAKFSTLVQDGTGFSCKQIAQDGVQFAWTNVDPNSANGKLNGVTLITMAPANRVDLLVKAPPSAGCYQVQSGSAVLFYVNVAGSAVNPPMNLPQNRRDFPDQPSFLADLDPTSVRVQRTIAYGQVNPSSGPPSFTIDNKKFDSTVGHTMHLNEVEMWTITNNSLTGVRHPFHIHQNPFQIIEIFDPTTMSAPLQLPSPWVWWDTFAIPPAKKNGDGSITVGYIKMLTRFADFTGKFVNHCHILGHEDRGMMQLIEVRSNALPYLKHH